MLEQLKERGIPMTNDSKNNRRYTHEEKDRLIARMFPPENCSLTELAKETGISKSTLSTWKYKDTSKASGNTVNKFKGPISSRDKFLIVMETYIMSEIELSKYCREKGLYVEDIKKWRTSCLSANDTESTDTKGLRQDLQDEKKRSKVLEKELFRKERALAETAALLVLRKKLGAILGDQEED
jgi:transposase